MPKRIQLRRTKGWRKPAGAVVVARPTKWGNPFRVGERCDTPSGGHTVVRDRAHAVALFRASRHARRPDIVQLRGRDLACWCPLDQPCHADVLLEIANRPIAAAT